MNRDSSTSTHDHAYFERNIWGEENCAILLVVYTKLQAHLVNSDGLVHTIRSLLEVACSALGILCSVNLPKASFSIQCSCDLECDLDPLAHLRTYLDNVAKFRGNWIGILVVRKICEHTE